MSVLDSTGAYLREGDWVRAGRRVGTYLRFESVFPSPVVQDEYSGDVIIETDGREESFPSFVSGADDACYDVQLIARRPNLVDLLSDPQVSR